MDLHLVLCLTPFSFLLFSAAGLLTHAEKPFFGAFSEICLGVLSLVLLNVLSPFTSVYVPISALTLLVCTFGGVPAAAALFIVYAFIV